MKNLLTAIIALTLLPESVLWLEGDSTLHPYSSTTTVMSVAGDVNGFTLTVPDGSLKSGKGGLDKNLRKHLGGDVVFTMTKAEPPTYHGTLKIAGVEKPVTLKPDVSKDGGVYRVKGSHELKMSDFGIKPPAMMMGAIKTDDKVTVRFDVKLEER